MDTNTAMTTIITTININPQPTMKHKTIFSSLLFAALASACSGNAGTGGHDHEHDEHVLITGYCPDFEVFAQATPMVAGKPGEILAHFSTIPGFRALESGKVSATLAVGSEAVRQSLDHPDHPGTYEFTLTPKAAGDAKIIFDITTGNGTARIVVDGLRVYSDEHEAEHAAEDAVVKSSNAVAFSKEMSWKVDFATEPVSKRPISQIIRTMAQVQPSQGDIRTVTAKSSGVVAFASSDLTDGKAVAAGQTLFRIDASTMADGNLNVRFLEAKNNYEAAKRDYERNTELFKERIATEAELTASRREFENAKALYDSLRGSFSGGSSSAASPISGFITSLAVTNGQYVEAGQPLATVAQNRDLFIKAEVQPSFFPLLSSINGATMRRPNGGEPVSLSELGGSVVSYGKATDTQSPLVPVVFRVNNTDGLLPGTFVEMFISAGPQSEAVAIPTSSLIEEMGNYFVYVQLTPEYFEKREVKTGRNDGMYTEILSGIDPGERVVSRGAVLVKLAQSSGALDAHSGHVH